MSDGNHSDEEKDLELIDHNHNHNSHQRSTNSNSQSHPQSDSPPQSESDSATEYKEIFKLGANGVQCNYTFCDQQARTYTEARNTVPHTTINRHPLTPDKWQKIQILHAIHNKDCSLEQLIHRFRGNQNNKKWEYYMGHMSLHSIKDYSRFFKPDSDNYKRLVRFITSHKRPRGNNKTKTKRFRFDPDKPHYGACPIIEEFVVKKRDYRAITSKGRDRLWLLQALKSTLANQRLMELLTPLMKHKERKLIKLLKVTHGWVYSIMVCLIIFIIHNKYLYCL